MSAHLVLTMLICFCWYI